MTDATLIAGTIDCNDGTNTELLGMTIGKPNRTADEYTAPLADLATVGPVSTAELVESRFLVKVKDATTAGVLTRVQAIADVLRDLEPLTVGLAGSANTAVLIPRLAECVEIPLEDAGGSRLANAAWTVVELVVRREPWCYGAGVVLEDAAGHDLPAIVDLSTMTGQAPAPLTATIEAPTSDFRVFAAGLYEDEDAVVADFVRALAAATWTGSTSAAADAAGWPDGTGDTVRATTSASLVTTSVDTADLVPGEYLVFVRAKVSAGTHYVYAGASAAEADMIAAAVTDTALAWQPVGVLSLPTQRIRTGGAAALYVGMKSDGAATVSANAVAFVPCSNGLLGWRHPTSHCHAITYQDGAVYADDVASFRQAIGTRNVRARGGVLVAIGDPSSSPAPTIHTHWTLAYRPRFEQLP